MKAIAKAWTLVVRTRNGLIVNALAVVALAIAVLRLIFEHTDELFASGAAVGTLLQDLSIAYLAAWIFNLLVVEVPRQRERDIAMRFGGTLLDETVGVARGMAAAIMAKAAAAQADDDAPTTGDAPTELTVALGEDGTTVSFVRKGTPLPADNTRNREALEAAAAKLTMGGESTMGHFNLDGSTAWLTWTQFFEHQRLRKEQQASSVMPLIHLFDAQLVEDFIAYTNDPFWTSIRTVAALPAHAYSGFDLTMVSEALSNLLDRGERVTAHFAPKG